MSRYTYRNFSLLILCPSLLNSYIIFENTIVIPAIIDSLGLSDFDINP